MSVEAFQRRASKVPPATKTKPKKDKNYEEHSFQQKPSGSFRRESGSNENDESDFGKMIAKAASLRQSRTCSTLPHNWNPDQKQSRPSAAKPPEAPQRRSSKLTVSSNCFQAPAPLQAPPHIPPHFPPHFPSQVPPPAFMPQTPPSQVPPPAFMPQTPPSQVPPPAFMPQTPPSQVPPPAFMPQTPPSQVPPPAFMSQTPPSQVPPPAFMPQTPPSPIPSRNTFKSATMTYSTSSQMAAPFFQPQTSEASPQPPAPSFPPQILASLLPPQAPALSFVPHLPSTSLPKPQPLSFGSQASQAQLALPASQPPQQLLCMDEDQEIYDDVESVLQQLPPPLPSPNLRKSHSFGKSSSVTPPALPSTSRPSFAQLQQNTSQLLRPPISQSDTGRSQPTGDSRINTGGYSLSSPMPMSEFVSKYQDFLPVQLKIQDVPQGVEGLRKGDTLNVHFSKSTKVAVVSDASKTQYMVPYNSSIKFGILFNPFNNVNAATQGYQFPAIRDITGLGSLPPVICARASYEVSAADSSVQTNDILIVKERKSQRRGHCLVCIDVKTNQRKKLQESCSGNFSTSPLDVSLHLPDLIANIPLPQQCIVTYDGPNAPEVTSLLPKGYVILKSTTVSKTVVASKEGICFPIIDMIKQSSPCLLEIPETLNMTVQVVSISDNVAQQLLQESCQIHKKMSTENISSVSCHVLPNADRHQLTFLSTVRKDKPHLGVDLTCPTRSDSSIPHSTSAQDLAAEDDMVDCEYDIPQVAMQSFLEKQQPLMKSHYATPRPATVKRASTPDPIPDEVYDVPVSNAPLILPPQMVSSPPVASRPLASEKSDPSLEMKDIRMSVERLEKGYTNLRQETDSLRKEVAKLKQQLKQQGGKLGYRPVAETESAQQVAAAPSDPQQNKNFLATLNCQQVQHLLREMNLEAYVDIFAREQISGSLLMDCDERILRDLGISSKLHQLRLMNVISGKIAAKSCLEKDHYVTCYKS